MIFLFPFGGIGFLVPWRVALQQGTLDCKLHATLGPRISPGSTTRRWSRGRGSWCHAMWLRGPFGSIWVPGSNPTRSLWDETDHHGDHENHLQITSSGMILQVAIFHDVNYGSSCQTRCICFPFLGGLVFFLWLQHCITTSQQPLWGKIQSQDFWWASRSKLSFFATVFYGNGDV